MSIQTVIIVLGSPNANDGTLSSIAQSRADTAITEYKSRCGCKIIVTGGYGRHFNTTDKPHSSYLAANMIDHGVNPHDIFPFVESTNTREDAVFSAQIVRTIECRDIVIVTSSFHMKRAQLIFTSVFPNYELQFVEAPDCLSPVELKRALAHECIALSGLQAQGEV